MGSLLLFIPLWEYECCGEPLATGDVVALSIGPHADTAAWAHLFPGATFHEGSPHGATGDGRFVRVRVQRIWTALAEEIRTENGLGPRPGSGQIVTTPRMQFPSEGIDDAHATEDIDANSDLGDRENTADSGRGPNPSAAESGLSQWGWLIEARAEDDLGADRE